MFRARLATSSCNLAIVLSKNGRSEDALSAARNAVREGRILVASHPDAFRPQLAFFQRTLANRVRALRRWEEALEAAQDRMLSFQQPDAFRPNLAVSLWVLAGCLDTLARPEEGLAANAEAIAVLTGPLMARTEVFADRVTAMVREYVERCQKLGQEPDMVLLGPIDAVFNYPRRIRRTNHER